MGCRKAAPEKRNVKVHQNCSVGGVFPKTVKWVLINDISIFLRIEKIAEQNDVIKTNVVQSALVWS